MLNLEHSVRVRLPWLTRYPAVLRPLISLVKTVTNEARFNRLLQQAGSSQGLEFVDRMLAMLGTRHGTDAGSSESVPASGPLLVVANHPLGMQDALVLLHWLGSIRPDVRMLGNDWLVNVPPLSSLLLPVDVFGGGGGTRARHLYRSLENGEALIIFPAGEVSRVHAGVVRDATWSDGFARLSFHARTPVLPVRVRAHNSAMFYALSMLSKPLSTALLPREATAGTDRHIGLGIGPLVSADELEQRSGGSSRRAAELMRKEVYRIGKTHNPAPAVEVALAPADRADDVAAELQRSEKLADLSDGKHLWLFTGDQDSSVMREIGRLRELTFRKVGEGSGKCRDLDFHDAHYEHLVLWDSYANCIAGSYRLGHAGRLISTLGMAGLYTTTLFEFSATLQPRLAQGLELGRSFVAPAYWRSRALEQLWQGIGLYLQRHPELHYLFGAVSMPITLPREAREWIAAAHLQCFGMPDLAHARRPFIVPVEIIRQVEQACAGLDSPAAMDRLKQHLDTLGVSLPVLYRQYVDLAEADGVQFLAFGDDPGFSGCVDGLVWLDLARLKPGKRARYLGQRSIVPSACTNPPSAAGVVPFGVFSEPATIKEVSSDALPAS